MNIISELIKRGSAHPYLVTLLVLVLIRETVVVVKDTTEKAQRLAYHAIDKNYGIVIQNGEITVIPHDHEVFNNDMVLPNA